jgi:hypothetical protein
MDYFRLLLSDNIVKNIRGYNASNDFMINGKIKQKIIGGVEKPPQEITLRQYHAGDYKGVVIV